MRGNRLLHLHGLKHQHQITLSDSIPISHGNLHDRALHGTAQVITASCATCTRGTGFTRLRGSLRSRLTGCGPQIGQYNLQPFAVHLYHHALALCLIIIHIAGGALIGFNGVLKVGLNPAGMNREITARGGGVSGVIQHYAVERNHCGHPLNLQFLQGAAGTLNRLFTVCAGDNQLSEHRIEVAANHIPLDKPRIPAHTGTGGHPQLLYSAGGGHERAARVLTVNTELNRMSAQLRAVGADLLTAGNTELLTHQINTGDLLGDRVLNLQTRIHLQERDGAVRSEQKLAGARALVASFGEDRAGCLIQPLCLLLTQERGGSLLNEFLVAALKRTIAGRNHLDVSVGIRQTLGLNVARGIQETFNKALAAAIGGNRLTYRRLIQLDHVVTITHHLNAAPATAECCFNGDRQAELVREFQHLISGFHRIFCAGH